jgi:hypothetical protein
MVNRKENGTTVDDMKQAVKAYSKLVGLLLILKFSLSRELKFSIENC